MRKIVVALALAALATLPLQAAPPELGMPRPGISLADPDLQSLYALLPLGQQAVAFGKNRLGEAALVLVTPPADFHVLLRFDDVVSGLVRSPADALLAEVSSSGGSTVRLLVLYHLDDTTAYVDKARTYLEVVTVEGGRLLDRGPAELLASNTIQLRSDKPEERWIYPSTAKYNEPATAAETRVFVADVNQDGFPDIVVWTKECRSRLQKDAAAPPQSECPSDFDLAGWTSRVKLFDPKSRKFEPLTERKDLARPSKELWERGFGSTFFLNFGQS
jgi:hypothetical protein